jgi:hypothetical protein
VGKLPSIERPDVVSRFEALSARMGLRRKVGLKSAESVPGKVGPMTVGVFRPIIILPQSMVRDWPIGQVEPVLLHELAHIRQHDSLVNWIQMIVQIIYFFHPLVWYANRRIRQERELICDDIAVGEGAEHCTVYCRSILRMAEEGRERSLYGTAIGMTGKYSFLGRRMMRILDSGYKGYRRVGRLGMALAVLVGAFSCAIASENTSVATSLQKEVLGPSGKRPMGSCLLAGRVLDERTDRPISHATVYLSYGADNDSLFVEVAEDGTFLIENVAAGEMSLSVIDAPGYQDMSYNPDADPGLWPRFTLAEEEQRREITFRLEAGNRISGRVLDENGQPFSQDALLVFASGQPTTDPRSFSFRKQASVQPDGTYLLDGLPHEPLWLVVQDAHAELRQDPYPPRYYPGTFSRDEAKKIFFDKKKSWEGIDIHLARKGGLVLHGNVTDAASGQPIANALVVVQYADTMLERIASYTDARGRYRVEGLGPGPLLIHADARPQGFVRTKKNITLSRQMKTAHIDLTLRTGVTISGTIITEEGRPAPIVGDRTFGTAIIKGWRSADVRIVGITGTRHKRDPISVTGDCLTYYAGEGEDRACEMLFPSKSTFLVRGMAPGQTELDLRIGAPDWQVVRITHQGHDVSASGIQTVAGQKVENVRIVIAKTTETRR